MKKTVLFVMMFFASLFVVSAAPTEINQCQVINTPGSYILNQSVVVNSTTWPNFCFYIDTSDVILNLNNNLLLTDDTMYPIAILGTNVNNLHTNITLLNSNISSFSSNSLSAIFVKYASNIVIDNFSFNNFSSEGVTLVNAKNVTLLNGIFTNMSRGLSLSSAINTSLQNIIINVSSRSIDDQGSSNHITIQNSVFDSPVSFTTSVTNYTVTNSSIVVNHGAKPTFDAFNVSMSQSGSPAIINLSQFVDSQSLPKVFNFTVDAQTNQSVVDCSINQTSLVCVQNSSVFGESNVTITVTDNNNKQNQTVATITVLESPVFTVAPQNQTVEFGDNLIAVQFNATWNGSNNNITYNISKNYNYSATDDIFEIDANGTVTQNSNATLELQIYKRNITAKAENNSTTTTVLEVIVQDTTPPVITVPANATVTVGDDVIVIFTATDNDKISNASGWITNTSDFVFNVSSINSGTLHNATPLAIGTYVFDVTAIDDSDNNATVKYQVTVNSQPTSPPSTTTGGGTSPGNVGPITIVPTQEEDNQTAESVSEPVVQEESSPETVQEEPTQQPEDDPPQDLLTGQVTGPQDEGNTNWTPVLLLVFVLMLSGLAVGMYVYVKKN